MLEHSVFLKGAHDEPEFGDPQVKKFRNEMWSKSLPFMAPDKPNSLLEGKTSVL